MTFFEKLKADAAPHWERYKTATLPVQAGVALAAVVGSAMVVSMLPSLIFIVVVVGLFYLVHTAIHGGDDDAA